MKHLDLPAIPKTRRQVHFATAVSSEEAADTTLLDGGGSWTGWQRNHWPVSVQWLGQRVYAFDKVRRALFAELEITRGGTFPYRSEDDFRAGARRVAGWMIDRQNPHNHFWDLPFRKASENPCIGFALKWKFIRKVTIPFPIPRFPQIGWLRLADAPDLGSATDAADIYDEGGDKLRRHRVVERNQRLRNDAKLFWQRHFGGRLKCVACSFDFETKYGPQGAEFIEMHHERQLAFDRERRAKRVIELSPVCSNCHRMIHRRLDDPMSIDELKALIKRCRRMTSN